jgi:hypothetical protein
MKQHSGFGSHAIAIWPPGPKVMALHDIHSGSKKQVQDRYREGEKVNCGNRGCDASQQGDFEKLVASALPVQEGDITNFVSQRRASG